MLSVSLLRLNFCLELLIVNVDKERGGGNAVLLSDESSVQAVYRFKIDWRSFPKRFYNIDLYILGWHDSASWFLGNS